MSKKVVKLNGRHKLYRELKFSHAWRFPNYSNNTKDIMAIESFLKDRYGPQDWMWKYQNNNHRKQPAWAVHWSDSKKHNSSRVYWIGVRDPEMIMVAGLVGLPV